MPLPETFDATLLSSEALAPRVRSFLLERRDQQPLRFKPGQWLKLVLPLPTGEIRRAYSIASPPNETPRFEIAVTEVEGGPGSGYLCGLGPRATLRAMGPQGLFTREASDLTPSLLVATGTGITPLRSMLRAALAAGSSAPLWVLLGARTPQELLYRAEFDLLARNHPNMRAFFTLSRADDAWAGLRGYVQVHVPGLFEELKGLGRGDPHVYICGLEHMVTAVRSLARGEMGVPRQCVHSERYD